MKIINLSLRLFKFDIRNKGYTDDKTLEDIFRLEFLFTTVECDVP